MWWFVKLDALAILVGMMVIESWGDCPSSSGRLDVEEICGRGNRRSVARPHSVSITEFGAVGDGQTVNTVAFQNAVFYLQSFAHKGGAQLYVPAGRWLTGSFTLISHLTLFLDTGSVILASQDPHDWPLIDPLPSYGRGRDLPGRRHRSLVYGKDLEDVVITGGNGTIDGQGSVWWHWFRNQSLNYTRGHLVEFINSKNIVVSNISLLNSPSWTIHPVYCSNVVIRGVTVVAPSESPNTDGVQPDSCTGVCIEDCAITSGGDAVSVKSGWDEYGIRVGLPSAKVVIRRITAQAPASAAIAFGSEMSGGIKNVVVEDVRVFNSKIGVHVKTGAGRGGYVKNISVTNVTMDSVLTAIALSGNSSSEHPDEGYDPLAYPVVRGIYVNKVWGRNISHAGSLRGLEAAPFEDICLSNITLEVDDASQGSKWDCSNVKGASLGVTPTPCRQLQNLLVLVLPTRTLTSQ
ncbi:probable polygalacturonase [Selaginella moellendorffii]|nr:probable polygalacturonase [Selaginella moellendorffii]|eukprot:XP_002988771.2 probable polygalacturonase [Selaginella moellendorffii]